MLCSTLFLDRLHDFIRAAQGPHFFLAELHSEMFLEQKDQLNVLERVPFRIGVARDRFGRRNGRSKLMLNNSATASWISTRVIPWSAPIDWRPVLPGVL